MEIEVKVKKFIVVPRDAFELLAARFVDADSAISAASDRCAETGMQMYVVELKAAVSRADRPIKVQRFEQS